MPNNVELWLSSAQADFQAAGHQNVRISDVPAMCGQIEDMVQSIALGLKGLTGAMLAMNSRINEIDNWVRAQQKERGSADISPAPAHATSVPCSPSAH